MGQERLVGGDHIFTGFQRGLDGGFGRELSPTDLNTIADVQRFLDLLAGRGYSKTDIDAIAHGNLVRFFRQTWS